MKKRQGFTLIELLAIIVILAIISLIAIPVVLNIIDKVRIASYNRSADNILDASRIYFKETQIDSTMSIEGNNYDKVMEGVAGRNPDSGEIYIKLNGEIALALKYDKYCYKKTYSDIEITQIESEECSLAAELDENVPIIRAKEVSVTITEGTSKEITSYFDIDANGASGIKSTVCTSDKDGNITNTNTLTVDTHEITCTVTKNNNKTASATMEIIVSSPYLSIGGQQIPLVSSGDGLYKDSDGVYRYKGTNPNNYITIDGYNLRILSVDSQGIKVMCLDDSICNYYYSLSDIEQLNMGDYLEFIPSTKLPSIRDYIVEDVVWNVGYTSEDFSNISLDDLKTTETFETKTLEVAGVTLSDVALAQSLSSSGYNSCVSSVFKNPDCSSNNWLLEGTNDLWTINYSMEHGSAGNTFGGVINSDYEGDNMNYYPVFVLDPSIPLSGTGAPNDAFNIVE